MGRRSPQRREELQNRYGDNAFERISDTYMEKARKLSAKYILFVNKDNKHGYCQSCCKDVTFDKTKHRETVECPNCGTKLTAQHVWRKPKCDWNVDWYVVGQLVDEDTFALRYIRVSHEANYVRDIDEKAREIYDFKHGWSYYFSNIEEGWRVNKYYFTEFTMNFHRRHNCCIGAKTINNIRRELDGLTALKYFDQLDRYYSVYVYPRDNISKLMDVSLYEKLEKVGLGKLGMERYQNYWKPFKYKRNETSLVKMLGINKLQFNYLRNHATSDNLVFIRGNKDIPIDRLEYIIEHNKKYEYERLVSLKVDNPFKMLKYIVNNNINGYEYCYYINTMKDLGYNLDNAYLYPRDFRKADNRVTKEYENMIAERERKAKEEELKRLSKRDELIKNISDGLRNMPDLKEFIGGAKGLFVYVPENAKELMEEGRALHNCLSTYSDRIAEGKTLVFFVRKLDTPDAPFIALEYCNGEIVQCRYDYNENVEDDNVLDFVEAFAKKLRENNVLYKAA